MLYISSSKSEVIRKLLELIPLKIDDAVRLCLDAQTKIRSPEPKDFAEELC